MIVHLYSIQDLKAGIFTPPKAYINEQVALRDLAMTLKKPGTPVSEYPQDYRVFYLGKYNDSNGKFTDVPEAPEYVSDVRSLLEDKA